MKISQHLIACGLCFCSFTMALHQERKVDVVFIGDSITFGAGLKDAKNQAPPALASLMLQKELDTGQINYSNQGISGYTTVDFLPGTNTAFAGVESAARGFSNDKALLVFSIMLGTNDSAISGPNGAPVSNKQYLKNLNIITRQLLHDFPDALVIVNRPVWYSPNTYNGATYLQEGLIRLQSYFPEIDTLVAAFRHINPGHVFKGDKKAFNSFRKNSKQYFQPEQGHQGIFYLHPNEKGAAVLAKYWADAIYKVIKNRTR